MSLKSCLRVWSNVAIFRDHLAYFTFIANIDIACTPTQDQNHDAHRERIIHPRVGMMCAHTFSRTIYTRYTCDRFWNNETSLRVSSNASPKSIMLVACVNYILLLKESGVWTPAWSRGFPLPTLHTCKQVYEIVRTHRPPFRQSFIDRHEKYLA